MQVGIVSMQRIYNYGSFLQAYGLKKTIEDLGHQVEFIDYKIEECIVKEEKSLFYRFKERYGDTAFYKFLKFWGFINYPRYKRNKMNTKYYNAYCELYDKECKKYLNITPEYKYRSKVDTLVIGSDEVFNCLQSNKDVGYSKELFGANANADKIISYAGSFGTTTVEQLKTYKVDHEVAVLLNKFDAISVRDKNSLDVVKKLTGLDAEYHIDPVLVYDFEEEVTYEPKLKNYIIVYAYGNRITKEEQIKIKEIAKSKNMKLISLGGYQDFCDEHIIATPFETLAYFKNADYIITDTFHGSVFSIKYNRPFITLIREGNRQKLSDLLERLGHVDRAVGRLDEMYKTLEKPVDFTNSNQVIERERKKSKKYLEENL